MSRRYSYKPDAARTMRARFAGKCAACGKAIAVGDTVRWTRTGGKSRTVCQSCTSGRSESAPPPEPRPEPKPMAAAALVVGSGLRPLPDAGDCCCTRGPDGAYRAEIPGGVTGILDLAGRTGFAVFGADNAGLADGRIADDHRLEWCNNRTLAGLSAALADPGETLTGAVSAMAEHLSGLASLPTRRGRRTVRRLDNGDDIPEPAELYAGNPDCWSEVRRVPRPRRRVRIGVNSSVLASQLPEELLYRGAAAVALADWYQSQGVAVELVLYCCARGTVANGLDELMLMRSTVKAFDGPLDIGALALATADVGFFRRALLACRARVAYGPASSGFGATRPLPAADRDCLDVLLDSDITSESAAVAAIRRVTGGAVETAA